MYAGPVDGAAPFRDDALETAFADPCVEGAAVVAAARQAPARHGVESRGVASGWSRRGFLELMSSRAPRRDHTDASVRVNRTSPLGL